MMMMIPVIIAALKKLSCFSMTENSTISVMTILKLSGTWPKSLPELLFMAFYNVL